MNAFANSIGLGQVQNQRLEQNLSVQQLQSLRLLMGTRLELSQTIHDTLQQIPVLEIDRSGRLEQTMPASDVDVRTGERQRADESSPSDLRDYSDDAYDFAADNELNYGDRSADPFYGDRDSDAAPSGEEPDGADASDAPNPSALDKLTEDEKRDLYSDGDSGESIGAADGAAHDFLISNLAEPQEPLAAHLAKQIALFDLAPTQQEIVVNLIIALDERGFLRFDIDDFCSTGNYSRDDVEDCIAILQKMDPPGVGARDARECLLLQLAANGKAYSLAYDVIRKCSSLLERQAFDEIASELGVSRDEVVRAVAELRELSPNPAAQFERVDLSSVVTPEVEVVLGADGAYRARLIESNLVHVRISPYVMNLLVSARPGKNGGSRKSGRKAQPEGGKPPGPRFADRGGRSSEARPDASPAGSPEDDAQKDEARAIYEAAADADEDFDIPPDELRSPEMAEWLREMRSYADKGKSFITNLERRYITILQVAGFIVGRQQEFFARGRAALRPMLLRDAAEALELDESTISRTVNGKYMLTPQGTLEMRSFFTTAVQTSSGESVSVESVKNRIREIIDSEDRRKPLSDDAIQKMLEAEKIVVARRTLVKYREAMKIPSSFKRKER